MASGLAVGCDECCVPVGFIVVPLLPCRRLCALILERALAPVTRSHAMGLQILPIQLAVGSVFCVLTGWCPTVLVAGVANP